MTHRLAATVALFACGATALAQNAFREPPVVVVTCKDADGKPVAGAQVHLFQYQPGPDRGHGNLRASGPFTTGEDGRARTAVAMTHNGGRYDRWLYAVVPGRLVGALRASNWGNPPGAEDPNAIEVRLLPSRSLTGRVSVPEGLPAKGVRVRILSLDRIDGDNLFGAVFPRQYGIRLLADVLPERFDCTVAEDGTFAFADLPATPLLYLAAEGPGLAHAQYSNVRLPGRVLPERIDLALERESVLAGKVLLPDGRPADGAMVEAHLHGAGDQRIWVEVAFDTRTGPDGAFRIAGLPASALDLRIEARDAVFRPVRLQLGSGQQSTDFAATLETPVEVTGVVLAEGDGKPVEGAVVAAVTGLQDQTLLADTVTDPQGHFTLRMPRGVASLYFGGVPAGFAYPKEQIVATLEVGNEKLQPLRFELAREAPAAGSRK